MKHILITSLLYVTAEAGERPVDGVYTGWEPLPGMKGEDRAEWFRLHRLIIRGDTLELWGVPVAIKNNELLYSASEGGFLSYKGRFHKKEGKLRVKFTDVTETDEGEFIEYLDSLANTDLPIQVLDRVRIKVGGIVYTLQDRPPKTEGTNKNR